MSLAIIANLNYGYEEIYGLFEIKTDIPLKELKQQYRKISGSRNLILDTWGFLEWCQLNGYIAKQECKEIYL